MARPIILGNGELSVGVNDRGMIHDIYYPYVGLENHTIGHNLRHRVGVYVDGKLSWTSDPAWEVHFSYYDSALIGHTTLTNHAIGIRIEFDDFVDNGVSALGRNIHVINMWNAPREVRLFMYQAFVIGDSRGNTDTAQYLPDSHAILHYRGRRAFVISGCTDANEPFDQYTMGLFGIEGKEGSFRDAEDGELNACNVEHGRVDSMLRFTVNVPGLDSRRISYWLAAGTSIRQALYVHKKIHHDGLVNRLYDTAQYWHKWVDPVFRATEKLTKDRRKRVVQSAMLLKAHTDKRGAVIASTDSAALNYDRDNYAYCWPRDGAYVMWPLIRMGYTDEPLQFFEFCKRVLHTSGYFSHKYRADGAIGSSWHPYSHNNGVVGAPIQEDETALVLFVFAQYYHMHPSDKLLREYYKNFILPMANFLAEYVDNDTGLPKPSYDLWEEQYLTTTYSTALTHAALLAGAELADIMSDEENAVRWRSVAEDIHTAVDKYMFDYTRKSYVKGIRPGATEKDSTIDLSSAFGAFMFGLDPIDSQKVRDSFATISRVFNQREVVGLPRYEHDKYRVEAGGLPNYWHITTLWYAQYCLETNRRDEAERILQWVEGHMYESGILAEQISPYSGYSLSIAPLAWSHAEYIATVLDSINEESHA